MNKAVVDTEVACRCFHCGLPADARDERLVYAVDGEPRHFCCHGCLAVCEAIVEAGLGDYYRRRTAEPGASSRDRLPEFLKRAELFNRPEIERTFARYGDGWREANLLLEDIQCPACLWLSERQLRRQPGVIEAEVDYNTHQAYVRWDPDRATVADMIRALAAIGYLAHPYDPEHSRKLAVDRRRRNTERLIFAGIFGMLTMHMSLGIYLMGGSDPSGHLPLWERFAHWISAVLSLLILIYPGQEFLAGAWSAIRTRNPTMDVPIALGLLGAFAGSVYATIIGSQAVYYDSIGMLVLFVLFARRLELNGREIAASRLDRMTTAAPATACRLDHGRRIETPVIDVSPGDRIHVAPGESVPLDGIIVSGTSTLNESLVTGESLPVVRATGDRVIAGSINGDQPLIVEVSKESQQSTLNLIRDMLRRAQRDKPASSLLADRLARYLVVGILVVASGTAAGWWLAGDPEWLAHTVAVLIITCPCALALATPVAYAISASRLLESGVLPARMSALETVARADTMAFDKTGTLTEGSLALEAVLGLDGESRDAALDAAWALAGQTRHPVSRALRRDLSERAPPIHATHIEHVPGGGVSGTIDGLRWRLGSAEFVAGSERVVNRAGGAVDGKAVAYIGSELGDAGCFVLADRLRDDASATLARLRLLGVGRMVVLSGDVESSVAQTVRAVGLDAGFAKLDPAGKLDKLRELKQGGRRVVAIGEGLNDAPLLAAADASVAVGDASDLSRLSSDFVVMGGGLTALAELRETAARTVSIVRQNLAWALAYNLLGIPLAVMGMVPPWAAAIGMSASSVIVVANSMRLRSSTR